MLSISPYHLSVYSKCPNKLLYLHKNNIYPPIIVDFEIIRDLIKRCYFFLIRFEKPPPWKFILKWTNKQIIENAKSEEVSYKDTKNVLQKIHTWYYGYFIKDITPGLINIPLSIGLGSNITLYDTLDLVILKDEKLTMYDFFYSNNISNYTNLSLYNNIDVHTKIWLLYKVANIKVDYYNRIVIGKNTIKVVTIAITDSMFNKIENIIRHITSGIRDNIFYPSFSEQCNSCMFNDNCNL
jgi:hypothetical protein